MTKPTPALSLEASQHLLCTACVLWRRHTWTVPFTYLLGKSGNMPIRHSTCPDVDGLLNAAFRNTLHLGSANHMLAWLQ